MEITAELVKQLREKTGAGIMDCKGALKEAQGNLDEAISLLRKKDIVKSEKKAGRVAAEGNIGAYIHMGAKLGVLVEVNCETDFAAQTDQFKELVKNISMHIAAADPQYIRIEDVPKEAVEKEREIFRDQVLSAGKPEHIADKIVEGKLKNYFSEVCLMEQAYIRDMNLTITQLLQTAIGAIGENISVRRFVRYKLGEGIEKKVKDFAQEVQEQMG